MASTDLATDREHLTRQMYACDEPLAVRIRTHELYTRPRMDFADWVLNHLPWRGEEVVLDIGCGAGLYIEPVCARLTEGGRLLCGDLSLGMLRDVAAKALPTAASLFNVDAMHLPLPDNCCDVVLANHMLYHVPDIERAVVEAHRVLRPNGYFVAATNARDSMRGFIELIESASLVLDHPIEISASPVMTRFNLENGRPFIDTIFCKVEMMKLASALVFPTVESAKAYVNSMRHTYRSLLPDGLDWDTLLKEVERQIRSTLALHNEYRVSKTTGLFLATKVG